MIQDWLIGMVLGAIFGFIVARIGLAIFWNRAYGVPFDTALKVAFRRIFYRKL